MKLKRSGCPDRLAGRRCHGAAPRVAATTTPRRARRRTHPRSDRDVRGQGHAVRGRFLRPEERDGRTSRPPTSGVPGKGKTVNVAYNPSGSGDGRQPVHRQPGRLRRFRLARSRREAAAGQGSVARGNDAWNLPLVFGPVAARLQPRRRRRPRRSTPRSPPRSSTARITKWNDPAIAALNPGATLPDQKITVIFRSDASGTTDNFQQYLDGRLEGAWTTGRRQGVQGRRRSRARRVGRRRAGRGGHPGLDHLRREVLRRPEQAAAAQIDTGVGRGRADRRDRAQGDRGRASSRPRAATT